MLGNLAIVKQTELSVSISLRSFPTSLSIEAANYSFAWQPEDDWHFGFGFVGKPINRPLLPLACRNQGAQGSKFSEGRAIGLARPWHPETKESVDGSPARMGMIQNLMRSAQQLTGYQTSLVEAPLMRLRQQRPFFWL